VPTGVIPLENCSISMSDFELFKKQNCFVISTRCRNYFVQASDQYEMACWIESIKLQAEKQVTEHKVCSHATIISLSLSLSLSHVLTLGCTSTNHTRIVGKCPPVQSPERSACST